MGIHNAECEYATGKREPESDLLSHHGSLPPCLSATICYDWQLPHTLAAIRLKEASLFKLNKAIVSAFRQLHYDEWLLLWDYELWRYNTGGGTYNLLNKYTCLYFLFILLE